MGEGGREKSSNVRRRDRGAFGYSGILPGDRCPQLLRLHVLPLGGVSLCSHMYMLFLFLFFGGGVVSVLCRSIRYGNIIRLWSRLNGASWPPSDAC